MLPEKIKKTLEKQHYEIAGKNEHSAVQVCRWTKNSLNGRGGCWKEKFYGIESHRCCQMSPAISWCPHKCLFCWRAIENTIGSKMSNKDLDDLTSRILQCRFIKKPSICIERMCSDCSEKRSCQMKRHQIDLYWQPQRRNRATLYPFK